MEVVLHVASLEVPGDEGAVVASRVDELICSVKGETHDVVLVASLLVAGQDLASSDFLLLLVGPDVDLLVPTHCDDVGGALVLLVHVRVELDGVGDSSDLSVQLLASVLAQQLSQALPIAEVPYLHR